MAQQRFVAGIALLFLTLLLGDCVYHFLYWFWATVLPNADVHTATAHCYAWFTATVVVGLSWVYVIWQSYYVDVDTKPKVKK
jgi:hypothetical protein